MQVGITEDQTTPEQLRDAFRVLANDKVNIHTHAAYVTRCLTMIKAIRDRTRSSVSTGPSTFDRLSERGDPIEK